MRWIIYIGDCEQHTVTADTEAEAIRKWCDDQGWDTPGEAASEYEMSEKDVKAVWIGT